MRGEERVRLVSQLPKLNVVGSIPITRSILRVRNEGAIARNTFLLLRLRWRVLVGNEAGLATLGSASSPDQRTLPTFSLLRMPFG